MEGAYERTVIQISACPLDLPCMSHQYLFRGSSPESSNIGNVDSQAFPSDQAYRSTRKWSSQVKVIYA